MNKKLAVYITGGDPTIGGTEKTLHAVSEGGADYVIIGIPFSDPVAGDSEVLDSHARALENGATLDGLFDMLSRINVRSKPVLSGYYNAFFTYGAERFTQRCQKLGIVGAIIHDLPFEECGEFGGEFITTVVPGTSGRAEMLAGSAKGEFINCVSPPGLDIGAFIRQIKAVTGIPCLVGLGAPTPEQAANVVKAADGVIIDSRAVSLAREQGAPAVKAYVEAVKAAINR